MIAQDLIQLDIVPLNTSDTVASALQKMEELGFVHWPIVEEGLYEGLLSEDLALDNDENTIIESLRHQLIHSSVKSDRHLTDAMRKYGEERVSILPVVNSDNHFLGYLLPQDILRSFGQTFGLQAPGSVLVLEVNPYDYAMSQIAQIVESNDAKILTSYVEADTDRQKYTVTIRINFTDLSAIIASFRRYDYTIVDAWHENRYERDLKQKFDQFMNYLNM